MGQTTTDQIGAALPRAPVTLPPHLDPRQSERAFEERMLPKMNQECQSDNILARQRALHSLTDIVHAPEKIAETIQVGLYDTIGGLLKSDDDMCRTLASEIFAVMCTHNIGRRASIRFIPNLARFCTCKITLKNQTIPVYSTMIMYRRVSTFTRLSTVWPTFTAASSPLSTTSWSRY